MHIPDETAMQALGARLAAGDVRGAVVYLEGPLGAGKTTVVRGLVRALGFAGPVKSPTFTLLEPYQRDDLRVYHFDLYRLADPEELEYIGARDYFGGDALCLVEWPERGAGFLAPADLCVVIALAETGRDVRVEGLTPRGRRLAAQAIAPGEPQS